MTKTIEQARRAAFESFAIEAFGPGSLELDGDGSYFWESTRNAFDFWRAALDSLCIELPFETYGCMAASEVIEAIHAAGVKTR